MVRKFKIVIFLLFLLSFSSIFERGYANAADSIYYVDRGHSRARDSRRHGSINKPWKTLAYAFQQLKPGDTLLIREGVYNNDRIQLDESNSGHSNAPIKVKAYPNEKVVLADGKEILFYGTRWWVIDGLIFRSFKSDSILRFGRPDQMASRITIRNCIFRDSKAEPISLLYAKDILIERNEFLRINTKRAGQGAHAIDILVRVKRVTIRDNKFLDIASDGIHLGATSSPVIEDITIYRNEFGLTDHTVEWGENGVDVKKVEGLILIKENHFHGFRPTTEDGIGHKGNSNGEGVVIHMGAQRVQVKRNLFEDNTVGLSIGDQQDRGARPTKNIRVQNNIFKDSRPYKGSANRPSGPGIALSLNTVQDRNTKIYHNTFVNNNIYLNTTGPRVEVIFQNNAIWGGRASVGSEAHIEASNNAWSRTKGPVPQELKGTNDLRSVRSFELDSQFRPQSTSLLINRGVDVGVSRDYDRRQRTDGKPDIGAFEFIKAIKSTSGNKDKDRDREDQDNSTLLYLPILIR